jgi:hypothetical protein
MSCDPRTTSILVRSGLAATLVALLGLGVALSNQSASATGLTAALGTAPAADGSLVVDVRRGAPHMHAHFNPQVARRMHHGAYRPANAWHSRHYWGDVVAGVALGTAVGVAAAGVIPARPAPHLCWYWNNPAMTSGYWDYC